MKLATVYAAGKKRVGMVVQDSFYDFHEVQKSLVEVKQLFSKPRFFDVDTSVFDMIALLDMGERGLAACQRVQDFLKWSLEEGDPFILRKAKFELNRVKWMPPVPRPPLMFGIGGNAPFYFRDKAFQIPGYPQGFLRPRSPHTLIGHMQPVTIPAFYRSFRSAAELGVIIGKPGRDIKADEALEHVGGYTIVNDICSDTWKDYAMSGEDERAIDTDMTVFGYRHVTSFYSRSTDNFAPVGPYLVTRDEVPNPYDLIAYNRLSGIRRERTHSQSIVNGIEQTIEFLSKMFTMRPGMILHMGAMSIDGYTVEEDMILTDEDYFEVEYEKIGRLRNPVNDLRAQKETMYD